jgi:hypothetical protein
MSFIGKNISLNTLKQNGLSAAPTSPVEGMIYYDDGTTNTEGLYIYRDSAWEFVGTKIDSQKLNPLDADPGSPIQGQFFYSDGTSRSEGLYVYDGTQWKTVGSGSSGINYIENNDAEGGTTGWSTYNDSSEVPVDGTGGSASILFTASSSSPLRGTKSFLIEKNGAASRQGEGISYDFSIEDADKGQLAAVSFDYSVTADYSTDNIKVYLYDVTNSRLINLVEAGVEAKSPAGKYLGYGTFSGGSTSYRVLVHIGSNDTDDYDIKIDNFRVGPADSKMLTNNNDVYFLGRGSTTGSITSDVTPIGFTTVTDTHDAYSTDTFTAPESGYYLINISVRLGTADDASTGVFVNGVQKQKIISHLIESTTSEVGSATLYLEAGDDVTFIKGSGNNTVTDDALNTWLSIIKIGKSLNESDSSGRTVYVSGQGSTTGAVTSDVTPIGFTEVTDTHGAWSGDQFTAPESGIYQVSSMVRLITPDDGSIDIYKNGSVYKQLIQTLSEDSSSGSGSTSIELQKGDVLELRKGSGNSTINNDIRRTWIDITKIAELPDVIQPNFKKFQTKILTSDVTSNGDISDFQFDNLTIGKTYEVKGQLLYQSTASGEATFEIKYNDAASDAGNVYGRHIKYTDSSSGSENEMYYPSVVFTATTTSLYIRAQSSFSSTRKLLGNGLRTESYITLVEHNNYTEVDTF